MNFKVFPDKSLQVDLDIFCLSSITLHLKCFSSMVFLVDKKKTISSWKIRAFMFLLSESHHHASSWIYMYIIYITKWFVKLHRIQKYTQILSQYFRVNECCPQMLKTFWLLNISKSKSWSKGKGGNYMVRRVFFLNLFIYLCKCGLWFGLYMVFLYIDS